MYTGETTKHMFDSTMATKPQPTQEPKLQLIIAAVEKNAEIAEGTVNTMKHKIYSIYGQAEITRIAEASVNHPSTDALTELERQLERLFAVIETMEVLNRHLSQII